jgi:hypothetical protein
MTTRLEELQAKYAGTEPKVGNPNLELDPEPWLMPATRWSGSHRMRPEYIQSDYDVTLVRWRPRRRYQPDRDLYPNRGTFIGLPDMDDEWDDEEDWDDTFIETPATR